VDNKDPLTGIYNREAFFELLARHVNDANTFKTKIALLIVDIDRFTRLNNLYGYQLGDEVLKKFATLLGSAVRNEDYVARIGDNRFAIILTNIMNVGHADLAAHKIHRLLEVPFSFNNEQIKVDATIAISLCPLHASKDVFLVQECESVLNEAREKNNKIGVSVVPEEELLSDSWDIEMALEDVLQNDQLSLYYQPQASLDSGGIVGAEALVRWEHPSKGNIPPDYFIPIAERMGLIKPITNWVLNTALRQSSEWTDEWGPLSISVNIPPDMILQPDFKDQVENALHLWGNDNTVLVLEIIERSLIAEPERCFQVLKELHEMGVNISVDDFGTGYSSLSYFELLPVNELKIDRSFIVNMERKDSTRDIVKFITELAHAFDLEVVAEGVENSKTKDILTSLNCDIIQGHILSKALPHEEIKKWLKSFTGLRS